MWIHNKTSDFRVVPLSVQQEGSNGLRRNPGAVRCLPELFSHLAGTFAQPLVAEAALDAAVKGCCSQAPPGQRSGCPQPFQAEGVVKLVEAEGNDQGRNAGAKGLGTGPHTPVVDDQGSMGEELVMSGGGEGKNQGVGRGRWQGPVQDYCRLFQTESSQVRGFQEGARQVHDGASRGKDQGMGVVSEEVNQ